MCGRTLVKDPITSFQGKGIIILNKDKKNNFCVIGVKKESAIMIHYTLSEKDFDKFTE